MRSVAENAERFERLSLFELHLGFEHQPRHREARHASVGTCEQRLRGGEFAGGDGRASADERGQGPTTAVSPALLPRTAAPGRSGPRAARRPRHPASRGHAPADAGDGICRTSSGNPSARLTTRSSSVAGDEAAEHEDEQQIERKLDPVGRRDEQRVAGRQPRRQRDGHGRTGEQEEPEEDAHRAAYRAAGAAAAPRPGARSCPSRSTRNASRLRSRSGVSPGIGVAASCRTVACNACTGFARVSKYCLSQASAAARSASKLASSRASSAIRADRSRSVQVLAQDSIAAPSARAAPRADPTTSIRIELLARHSTRSAQETHATAYRRQASPSCPARAVAIRSSIASGSVSMAASALVELQAHADDVDDTAPPSGDPCRARARAAAARTAAD